MLLLTVAADPNPHLGSLDGGQSGRQSYAACIKIGFGFTYSKYNTLMHYLSVLQSYWHNPDLNAVQARSPRPSP